MDWPVFHDLSEDQLAVMHGPLSSAPAGTSVVGTAKKQVEIENALNATYPSMQQWVSGNRLNDNRTAVKLRSCVGGAAPIMTPMRITFFPQ